MRIFRDSRSGFTLVELLIVVAIIGVLATIGVPTFKRMVQKAKKSEAKVALGGLVTAETAFFSEYNGYGNHLDRLGFEMDGNRQLYSVGFPDAACVTQAVFPTAASPIGVGINTGYPQYYAALPPAAAPRTVVGRVIAGGAICLAGNVADINGTAYTASATGAIAPGLTYLSPLASQDQWTINQNRALINVNDGVQ